MGTDPCQGQGAMLLHPVQQEQASQGMVPYHGTYAGSDAEILANSAPPNLLCKATRRNRSAQSRPAAESLRNSDDTSKSGGQACVTLPDFCTLHSIDPGGWCFYDSILAHLPQPLPPDIQRYSLVGAILECVARRRDALEQQLCGTRVLLTHINLFGHVLTRDVRQVRYMRSETSRRRLPLLFLPL